MRPAPIVVRDEFSEHRLKMAFVDGNDMVEIFAADGPNQALTKCIRLRSPHGRFQGSHTECFQRFVYSGGERAITVVNQKPVRVIESHELAELLSRPIRGWVLRHVEMENSPGANLHGKEDIQDAKVCGDRNKEVARHNLPCMIANEGIPSLAGRSSGATSAEILPDGAWRNLDSELQA